MFEVGYQGLIENKLGVTVDLYYNQRKNVLSAPIIASPFVVQPTLAQDLTTAIMDGLDTAPLAELGLSPQAIANMYAGLAQQFAFNADTGQPNVLGLVSSDQTPVGFPNPTLDAAYYNINEIDYFGLDIFLKYYFLNDFAAHGSFSWISQTLFEDVEVSDLDGSSTTDFSLNVPATKYKFGVEYRPQFGPNGFFMVRYQDEWMSITGIPWTGPVNGFLVTDVGIGYIFKNNLSLNLTGSNLFNDQYRGFYGAPKIGRQVLAKAFYHF